MKIVKLRYDQFCDNKREIISMLSDIFITNKIALESEADSLAQKKANEMEQYIIDKSACIIGATDDSKLVGFAWFYRYTFCGEARFLFVVK